MIYQRIRYFLKAAECGSFAAAANLMFVSPQALTKQVGLLEEEIGGKLFERSPQGVQLTSLGEMAYRKFLLIDRNMTSAMEVLKKQAGTNKEKVNIGIFSALPQDTLVTPLISFLLTSLSDYQIGLTLIDLSEGRQMLMDGKIDLLLTNTHEDDNWDGCGRLSFGSAPAMVNVSLLHPWAVKDSITIEDMRQETFLKLRMEHSVYNVPRETEFYEIMPCKEVRYVDNFETMYALLQQGDCFAVFPLVFYQLKHSKIKSLEFPGETMLFHTALIYQKNSDAKNLGRIIQELKEEFDLVEC